ncbi:hypothetical protein MML63_06480 [Kosakonia sacchari]|uniref:hypothetical protein n=1 Tax=Kosakonia sacchari TaxID=1158459 RepID=UPI0025B15283|nr:hypothetical protein [Kosakonia sacchari]MDN2485279.1 hypothetical protein [Kosakonia sacchari]
MSVLEECKILSTEDIDVSSEKENNFTFEDYNLDGYEDFSVWHLDEGMGICKIYRSLNFTSTLNKFKALKPGCGDDFVNILNDGEVLINTLYHDNGPKSFSMLLDALK